LDEEKAGGLMNFFTFRLSGSAFDVSSVVLSLLLTDERPNGASGRAFGCDFARLLLFPLNSNDSGASSRQARAGDEAAHPIAVEQRANSPSLC
jgi:hypothetical protein